MLEQNISTVRKYENLMGSDNSAFKRSYQIDKDGCWLWVRYLDKGEYGEFYNKWLKKKFKIKKDVGLV